MGINGTHAGLSSSIDSTSYHGSAVCDRKQPVMALLRQPHFSVGPKRTLPFGKDSPTGTSHVAFQQPGHHEYRSTSFRARDLNATSSLDKGKIFTQSDSDKEP